MVDIKMYMSEISKFKISDLKAQKMIILWTMKHVSAIRKHPVDTNTNQIINQRKMTNHSFLERMTPKLWEMKNVSR